MEAQRLPLSDGQNRQAERNTKITLAVLTTTLKRRTTRTANSICCSAQVSWSG